MVLADSSAMSHPEFSPSVSTVPGPSWEAHLWRRFAQWESGTWRSERLCKGALRVEQRLYSGGAQVRGAAFVHPPSQKPGGGRSGSTRSDLFDTAPLPNDQGVVMPPFLRRLAPIAAILVAILAAALTSIPAQAHETEMPHLIHEYEGWIALSVVVLSLVSAGLLVRRALRR
jgi:hypothetical protein